MLWGRFHHLCFPLPDSSPISAGSYLGWHFIFLSSLRPQGTAVFNHLSWHVSHVSLIKLLLKTLFRVSELSFCLSEFSFRSTHLALERLLGDPGRLCSSPAVSHAALQARLPCVTPGCFYVFRAWKVSTRICASVMC